MSLHICFRCSKEFKFPYLLKRHNERKYPCKVVENGFLEKEPLRTTQNHSEPLRTTQNHLESLAIVSSEKKTNCEYCNQNINKKMLKRHQREHCLSIPNKIKKKLLEKYNKNRKHIKSLEVAKTTNINTNTNINNTNSNNTTNNQINNNTINNNITNNVTIKINPLGQENIDFLKKEEIITIINRCYMAIPDLIMKIHNRKENMNFFIPNFNKKTMAYLDKNNEIKYNDYNEICEKIINNNIKRLGTYFKDHKQELESHIKNRMKKVIQENNDEVLNSKYIDNIKYYLMNKSRKNKKQLNKFIDELEKKIKVKSVK